MKKKKNEKKEEKSGVMQVKSECWGGRTGQGKAEQDRGKREFPGRLCSCPCPPPIADGCYIIGARGVAALDRGVAKWRLRRLEQCIASVTLLLGVNKPTNRPTSIAQTKIQPTWQLLPMPRQKYTRFNLVRCAPPAHPCFINLFHPSFLVSPLSLSFFQFWLSDSCREFQNFAPVKFAPTMLSHWHSNHTTVLCN